MTPEINQYGIFPGVYEHYKGGLYVVESILTHIQEYDGGPWIKQQDPYVIYRNLEAQYENINGREKWVLKTYGKRYSSFTGEVDIDGKKVKRFKLA